MAIYDNGLNPALPGYDPAEVAAATAAPSPTPAPSPAAASQPFRYTQQPASAAKPQVRDVNEDAIREATRKRMQSTIDAIDAQYAGLVAQENVAGQERAGQTRAVTSRSGTLGSDFGTAAAAKTEQFNQRQVQNIEAQKAAQVASVMQGIEDRASAQIAREKEEALGQYQMEFGEWKAEQEAARKDLQALAQSGFDLGTMDPNAKATFFKQAGYDDPVIGSLIFNAYKPKPEQIDYQYIEQRDGSIMAIGQDPLTGQLKKEIIPGASPDVGIVIDMITKYPDAQILPTDDVLTASQKIQNSRLYREQVRPPVGAGGGGGGGGTISPTGNPTVDAWVSQIRSGEASISNVPAGLKNSVITALNAAPAAANPQALQTAQEALDAITALESHSGKKGAVGSKGFSSLFGLKSTPIGGTNAAGFVAELERVKSLLTLPNLQYLKGLGAMSDREFATIQSASAALNRDMSEADFDRELQRIKGGLQNTVNNLQSGGTQGAGTEDLRSKYNY